MKERNTVDTILLNKQTQQAQRVEATAESIQRVANLGGVGNAMNQGVCIELTKPQKSIVFNDVLVPLYPTIQTHKGVQN